MSEKDIKKFSVIELKHFCKEHSLKGYSKLRKAELVELVEQFLETQSDEKTEFQNSSANFLTPAPLDTSFRTAQPSALPPEQLLAEEQKILHAWISVREILLNGGNAFELKNEIFNASREITRTKRRITELQKQCEVSDLSAFEHVANSDAIVQTCEAKEISEGNTMDTAKECQIHWFNYGIFGYVYDGKTWITADSFGGKANCKVLWPAIPDNLKQKKWLKPVLGNNVWKTREESLISEDGVLFLLDNNLLKKCPDFGVSDETLRDYFLTWVFPKLKSETEKIAV